MKEDETRRERNGMELETGEEEKKWRGKGKERLRGIELEMERE